MTKSLFAEIDEFADNLRKNYPDLRDDLSEFRQRQKKHLPELTKEEFLELFATWRLHYIARIELEIADRRARGETTATEMLATQHAPRPWDTLTWGSIFAE